MSQSREEFNMEFEAIQEAIRNGHEDFSTEAVEMMQGTDLYKLVGRDDIDGLGKEDTTVGI